MWDFKSLWFLVFFSFERLIQQDKVLAYVTDLFVLTYLFNRIFLYIYFFSSLCYAINQLDIIWKRFIVKVIIKCVSLCLTFDTVVFIYSSGLCCFHVYYPRQQSKINDYYYFKGRNFCDFAIFGKIRESLFPQNIC